MRLRHWIEAVAASRAAARPLAVARIASGIAMLVELPNTAATLQRLTMPTVIHAPYVPFMPRVNEPIAAVLIVAWLIGAVGLVVGFRTRLAGSLLTVTLALVLFLDQQLYSNHLYLMLWVAGLLTLADSGAAISLDARQAGERSWVSGWPVTMLCIVVSIVYGFAALAKLNPDFLSGSVVASYLRRDGLLAVPDAWRSLEPMLILSLLAVCSEAFVSVFLWVPRWRPAALVVGLGLHVFITGWLSPTVSLLVFSLLILPLYLLFVDAVPAGRAVVWDDGCSFCGAWVRWFRRLDWLRALRFVPRSELVSARLPISEQEAMRALQVVLPAGGVRGGFAAVSAVLEILPVSFLWAPILRLQPIAAVGERVYRRVAARRLCELPLRDRAAVSSRSA